MTEHGIVTEATAGTELATPAGATTAAPAVDVPRAVGEGIVLDYGGLIPQPLPRPLRAGGRRGHRPRLRRAVLAAHRAPRARVRRLQRAAAAPRRRRGGRAAPAEGLDPERRAGVGLRRRRAAPGSRAARARHSGAGHL